MTDVERVEKAHALVVQLKEVISSRTKNVFQLGLLLKEIRDGNLYLSLGYDTFLELIADPDISFQKTSAYSYIELYECFIIKHKVDFQDIGNIPYSKLLRIMKYVTEENIDDLISMARNLGGRDLSDEIEFLGLKIDKDGDVVEYRTRGEKLFESYKKLPAADRAEFDREYRRYNEIEPNREGSFNGNELCSH